MKRFFYCIASIAVFLIFLINGTASVGRATDIMAMVIKQGIAEIGREFGINPVEFQKAWLKAFQSPPARITSRQGSEMTVLTHFGAPEHHLLPGQKIPVCEVPVNVGGRNLTFIFPAGSADFVGGVLKNETLASLPRSTIPFIAPAEQKPIAAIPPTPTIPPPPSYIWDGTEIEVPPMGQPEISTPKKATAKKGGKG